MLVVLEGQRRRVLDSPASCLGFCWSRTFKKRRWSLRFCCHVLGRSVLFVRFAVRPLTSNLSALCSVQKKKKVLLSLSARKKTKKKTCLDLMFVAPLTTESSCGLSEEERTGGWRLERKQRVDRVPKRFTSLLSKVSWPCSGLTLAPPPLPSFTLKYGKALVVLWDLFGQSMANKNTNTDIILIILNEGECIIQFINLNKCSWPLIVLVIFLS